MASKLEGPTHRSLVRTRFLRFPRLCPSNFSVVHRNMESKRYYCVLPQFLRQWAQHRAQSSEQRRVGMMKLIELGHTRI